MSKNRKPKPVTANSRPLDSVWRAGALRALCLSRGLRAEDLAARTGKTAETARRWLTGRTIPSIVAGREIADLLGVDMVDLMATEPAGASATSSSARAAKR